MGTEKKFIITGGSDNQLLPELRTALKHATEIEIAVSFIKFSGLELLFQDLEDALSSERKVKLTLLTSDYLCVTDPLALRKLMLLSERDASINIFQAGSDDSFHLKAYIFIQSDDNRLRKADVFIGSSNISRPALTEGLEWNYHLDYPNDADSLAARRISEARKQFQDLLTLAQVEQLTFPWIEAYQQRYDKAHADNKVPLGIPGSDEPEPAIPTPKTHQVEALQALESSRSRGHSKALVVLATGMGKTYLSAFDARQFNASHVLFVAHREEILLQAEQSFLAIFPKKRVGRYTGKQKDSEYDLLFASVQTLGQSQHLERFTRDHFDYMVVDEFHHAAASSYKRLLEYFKPKFMLGLTATPDRSDQSDILKLCDNNLVYRRDVFDGIKDEQLCPFHYYGIYDNNVDYAHIPWRNGRFDPNKLSVKLATIGRAKHALLEWQNKAQKRTLAFCASRNHADYMASYFTDHGVQARSVHTESGLLRSEALELLESGTIQVLFSVDLFNEGVDLPEIDTVMMLRPTESKILFLQQFGRGLRINNNKERLIVLDFVGNHHSFLNRPEMLLGGRLDKKPTRRQLIELTKNPSELLPDGCYINYDLGFIQFLESLIGDKLDTKYHKLKNSLGRRPTLLEFWKSGAQLSHLSQQYGSWWEFIDEQDDATPEELSTIENHTQWFRDLTKTKLSKSYKLVLLKTLIDHKMLGLPVSFQDLSKWSLEWYKQNQEWQPDLPESKQDIHNLKDHEWITHWRSNPIKFWCTPEQGSGIEWFIQNGMTLIFQDMIEAIERPIFSQMTSELVEWRLAQYLANRVPTQILATSPSTAANNRVELPYFPNIKIACGHFKTGSADVEEFLTAPSSFTAQSAGKHFIARASGNSMNGGKTPIYDGDYLLLEQITSENAGSISDKIIAIERQDESGDNQYLLRKVLKNSDGSYTLRAQNPDYEDLIADESMVTFARLKQKADPLELYVGHEFMREEIPPLFGEVFNAGNWNSGHVVINSKKLQILLVTLNKQGKKVDQQYHDYFIDNQNFHWQSQNSTSPDNKRGQELIAHQKIGSRVYLFVRENKLLNGKASPFHFYGEVGYLSHEGSKPMSVIWKLQPQYNQ